MSDFKEWDPSLPANRQGLYQKFLVNRVDGSDSVGGKHEGCRYFVLDITHDEHAPAAMQAYANSCKNTHPELAADIEAEFGKSEELIDVFGVKPNGETVLIGKAPITPRMKAQDLIRELIGYGDFDDDDSEHAMWLYTFEQFQKFVENRAPT